MRSWGGLRRLPAGGVVALVVLSVAACSDAGTSMSASSPPLSSAVLPATSSSPAGTSADSLAPVLPDAAKQPTRPGAEAFVRHFFAVYNQAFWTADAAGLQLISDSKCIFCNSAIESIESLRADHDHVIGGRISVSTAVAGPGNFQQGLLVNLLLDQEPGRTLSSNGSSVDTTPARMNSRVDVAIRWDSTRWVFLDAHIIAKGES